MYRIIRKFAYALLSVGVLALGSAAFAGSTIGGNPSNGGGVMFGAPLTGAAALNAALIITADDDGALEAAVESGDSAAISQALNSALNGSGLVLTNTVTGQSVTLTAATDLAPLPGLTGAESVAILRGLIFQLAAVLGLPEDAEVIETLLAIAETARE